MKIFKVLGIIVSIVMIIIGVGMKVCIGTIRMMLAILKIAF